MGRRRFGDSPRFPGCRRTSEDGGFLEMRPKPFVHERRFPVPPAAMIWTRLVSGVGPGAVENCEFCVAADEGGVDGGEFGDEGAVLTFADGSFAVDAGEEHAFGLGIALTEVEVDELRVESRQSHAPHERSAACGSCHAVERPGCFELGIVKSLAR